MVEIWDYLMRRKRLLIAIIAIFFCSSVLSYRVMHDNDSTREPSSTAPSYITIDNWGQPESEIEIPHTGNLNEIPTLSIISPRRVVELVAPGADNDGLAVDNVDEKVLRPEHVVTISTSVSPTSTEIKTDLFCDILLLIMSLTTLALGGYLTYQHFMR